MLRLLSVPATLLAGLSFLATGPEVGPEAASVPAASAPRPVVLLVHGRGLQDRDTASVRRAWRDALDDGVTHVSGHRLLEEDDLRLVWYADAVTSGPDTACPEDARASRREGWARDLATTLSTAGTLMALAAEWMGGPEGAALRALAGDLHYLGDERRRCGAEERLARALEEADREGRPVVLVAHSFGALVSYHHLRTRDATVGPRIERWITIGSPLGHPELRRLLLDDDGGGLPPRVGSWVNVYDPRDPFSARLVGLDGAEESTAVEDRRTERSYEGDPHDPVRYLTDPATAGAVLEAWCGVAGGAPEPACGTEHASRRWSSTPF